MDKNISVQELLDLIDHKINNNEVVDSVHKIKLITTRQMIEKLIVEAF